MKSEGRDNISSPPQAQGAEPPRVGGVRFGPALAGTLYALLVASAALALWARGTPGRSPPELAQAAPWVFLAFVIAFALYRFGLVRARRYPAFKAFFQVGAAVLFFMLLLPAPPGPSRQGSSLEQALVDPAPHVRAMAAELAGHRRDPAAGPGLVQALTDVDPVVREKAHEALVRIAGEDLGRPDAPGAVESWRKRYP